MILALDPGETTGYAVVYQDGTVYETGTIEWGDWELLTLLMDGPPDVVIYEAFRLYRNKAGAQVGSEFEPAQVIGMVKYLAWQRGVRMVSQPASMIHTGRGLNPPARRYVEEAGMGHINRHAKDALAHALVWLKKRGVDKPPVVD